MRTLLASMLGLSLLASPMIASAQAPQQPVASAAVKNSPKRSVKSSAKHTSKISKKASKKAAKKASGRRVKGSKKVTTPAPKK